MKATLPRSTPFFALLLVTGLMSTAHQTCSAKPPGGGDPPVPLPTYTIRYLGTLGGAWSITYDINSSGTVVGSSQKLDGSAAPFVYNSSTGAMTDLGQINGWLIKDARAINDSGQIVGYGYLPGWETQLVSAAYRYSSQTGTIESLGTLPGACGWAINNNGDVAGTYSGATGGASTFLWRNATEGPVPLASNGSSEYVNAISNHRDPSGNVYLAGRDTGPNGSRAWRYDTATASMLRLGTLPTSGGRTPLSEGRDMNNTGVVTGWSTAGRTTHAFIAAPFASMLDLGTLGGNSSEATCINDAGNAAGISQTSSGLNRAFVYTNTTGMFDLEPRITTGLNSALLLNGRVYATRINSGGQICGPGGEGFNFNGVHGQAYIITPTPQ